MAVTDLTGTKWRWNSFINPGLYGNFDIDFNSNNTSYYFMGIFVDPDGEYLTYNSFEAYDAISGWYDQAYRTIQITGGTDATNTDLISWLQYNAEQIVDQPVLPSFSDVEVTPHEGYITMTINGVDFNLKTAASN